MILIYSVVLLVCLWVMAMRDAISKWMDEAEFEEEYEKPKEDVSELDNSEYDWGHNIKNYMDEEL
jgi:hypothetical protein